MIFTKDDCNFSGRYRHNFYDSVKITSNLGNTNSLRLFV